MAKKRQKPEEIVAKLRQIQVAGDELAALINPDHARVPGLPADTLEHLDNI